MNFSSGEISNRDAYSWVVHTSKMNLGSSSRQEHHECLLCALYVTGSVVKIKPRIDRTILLSRPVVSSVALCVADAQLGIHVPGVDEEIVKGHYFYYHSAWRNT